VVWHETSPVWLVQRVCFFSTAQDHEDEESTDSEEDTREQ
jgi:hypothetical protein